MQVPIRKGEKDNCVQADYCITQKKFDELQSQLAKLKKDRPKACEEMKTQAEDGDFSENAGYQMAKGRLRRMNNQILKIENLLKHAQIIENNKNCPTVQLGQAVTLAINGRQKKYRILGSLESDPAKGIISHNSPLGVALMGRRVGDMVKIKLDNREVEYKIIKIE